MTQNSYNPLITIGIPTYNRATSFLKESLGCVLAQTYPNIEIIVSDNCSTDGTEALVRGVGDDRVRYFRHERAVKPHENADFCLREAKGDYFLLLHDDDLIDADFIQVCVDAIDGKDVGFVRTGARKIDGEGRVTAERKNPHGRSSLFDYLDAVLQGQAVTYFCNTLHNTKHLKAIGGLRSREFVYQDVIATIKLACLYGRVDIEDPKASYRIHGSKLGKATEIAKWCDDSLQIIEVMCEGLPEKVEHFRGEGMRLLCRRNYRRASHLSSAWMRVYAYLVVYKKFGYHTSGHFRDRIKKAISKSFGWRVPDGAI